MRRVMVVLACGLALAGCASTLPPPEVPAPLPRLMFDGELDFSRPGIWFNLRDQSAGLNCQGHTQLSRLPPNLTVPLTCNGAPDGNMQVTKAATIRGDVTLANGQGGDVVFTVPVVVRAVVPVPQASLPSTTTTRYVKRGRGGCGSRGGPGYRTKSGKCASWRR